MGGLFIFGGILMSLGIQVPLFGVGLGSGMWISVIGLFIIMAASHELSQYKKLY